MGSRRGPEPWSERDDRRQGGAPSPPNTFFAQTTAPILSKTQTLAVLSDNVGRLGQTHLLKASFDLFVASYGGAGLPNDAAGVFVITVGGLAYELALTDATHAYFVEVVAADASAPVTHALAGAFGTNSWTTASILLRAPTTTAPGHVTITLTASGQTVLTALDTDLSISTDVSNAEATVNIGVQTDLSPAEWAVRFDNVLIDTL